MGTIYHGRKNAKNEFTATPGGDPLRPASAKILHMVPTHSAKMSEPISQTMFHLSRTLALTSEIEKNHKEEDQGRNRRKFHARSTLPQEQPREQSDLQVVSCIRASGRFLVRAEVLSVVLARRRFQIAPLQEQHLAGLI